MNKTIIYLDSCAWNVFHRYNVDLVEALPREEFDIRVTKEVAAFEMISIPHEKKELRDYIDRQVERCGISTHSFFGFASMSDPPGTRYRIGGFNEGSFASYKELELIKRFKVSPGKERKTGLYKNEADASLAVRACSGGIVLTAERKNKSGPLKKAIDLGGKIVDLNEFRPDKQTLREYISVQLGYKSD